ncbi:MAG TPA: fatty acid oxidation complex subunit alpha FadJ [Gemmatimonadales bacterium]|nr:fatty acid oxidation complex subunit alpha FadJ [Gemmatimonadales bacterium]
MTATAAPSAVRIAVENGVAVLTLDLPGEPVNKLTAGVKRELEEAFARLRGDPAVRAVVLISGKPDIFIAGADIDEFTRLRGQAEAEELSREGQAMLQRVEDYPKPVVAAIHGACLGGGLELALACHYRVATDHPKTQLGLPEVQLGIIPGAGGTQRLPRLIGVRAALDIILAGKSEPAAKAHRLGLVDELVPPSILRRVAVAAAERLAREGKPTRRAPGGLLGGVLERTPPGRAVLFGQARKAVLEKTGGHYPAPLAALEAVRVGLERGERAGYELEHRRFGELAVSDVSRKLVRIFFASTALKKDNGLPPGVAAEPRAVERLAVVGAGFMGAAIAGTAVTQAGVQARLKDTDLARVGKGLKAATDILAGRLKRRRITKYEYRRLAALLSGGVDWAGFRDADLVIEAVFEDLEVKRQVLREVERAIPPEAIVATNTSTIPIGEIAAGAERPGRVLGMHFFSPVEKMPLLEVIPHEGTEPWAIVTAVHFGRRMGKTVIVVRDRPGFWVNRILTPYLNEAGRLLEEGVPIDVIDRTMTRFGFPVGPIALLDEVGLDVAAKAAKVMHQAFGDRLEPAEAVGTLLADRRLGRKNGRGFYVYHEGRKTGVDESVYDTLGVRPKEGIGPDAVERRLVYAMLNEAAMAVGEGVVRTPRDGDIGAIFGFGFPPFRGGPLRMIDDLGAAKVVLELDALAAAHGDRFRPTETLRAMAREGRRFYPAD